MADIKAASPNTKLSAVFHIQLATTGDAIAQYGEQPKEIEWSVSEEGLATIDENGVLTAQASGIVIVTATTQCGKTDEIEIEIYSNAGLGVVGVCGTAAAIGTGVTVYFKKKKKKQDTSEI